MDGRRRPRIISLISEWISERKHKIVYTSVNKELYFKSQASDDIPKEINTIWKYLGFHLVLAIQRYSQPEKENKGHTVLTFDNEEREEKRFIQLIKTLHAWSDEYYAKEKNRSQMDQIVDVPHFGDSKDFPLIPMADFPAFFFVATLKYKTV